MSSGSEFELVIGLGGFCQVAYQIERRFGPKMSSPFDWLVTPLISLKKVFDSGGQQFSKSIITARDGHTAVCTYYGVCYHHEFERHIMTDGVERITITAEAMQNSRGKLLHKYDKMIDMLAAASPVLFIRLAGHCDHNIANPYTIENKSVTTDDLNDLCTLIGDRFPNLKFRLAFVYLSEYTKFSLNSKKLDTRVDVFSLDDDGTFGWYGSAAAWDNIFDNYKYKLND